MKRLAVTAASLLLIAQTAFSAEAFPVITLPVTVHFVRSTVHPKLQATVTETDVRAIFAEVNTIWAQAGIQFVIKGFGEIQARPVPPKKWFERDRNWVRTAISTDSFDAGSIDVCFIREMGPNGFFYGEPVVVCEQPEFTKVKGGAENPVARVTAHELGHVLTLQHRQDHVNLMASGRNGVSMNNQEIKDARTKAREISAAWSLPASLP